MITRSMVWQYLRGCMRLAAGEHKAIEAFDLSADGFYQSFQAMLFALPIMALTWMSIAGSEQIAERAQASPNVIFIYSANRTSDMAYTASCHFFIGKFTVSAIKSRPISSHQTGQICSFLW